MIENLYEHILNTAKIPSFSTYEERLHPYINDVFESLPQAEKIEVEGNSLIYRVGNNPQEPFIALAAHLDKINHYGEDFPEQLPVRETDQYLEGAMDDCAGVGILLYLAEQWNEAWPNLYFFFSEMEESKGLKEHPYLLRNNGEGYHHGLGAERIARKCIQSGSLPQQVITVDTTPLFKGDSGIALYAKHWELNDLGDPTPELRNLTRKAVERFLSIDENIKVDNNTNDYLHYGEIFNRDSENAVVSVALEPAIYPYHTKGERVFKKDIQATASILRRYLTESF